MCPFCSSRASPPRPRAPHNQPWHASLRSHGCNAGQAGQVESALGLWRQMAASGAPPSVDNCNALLNACIDCGNGERALDIYRSMPDLGAYHPPHYLSGWQRM